eukprot:TRINITY_DN9696_c0_g1_i1.p1 TRINITY_DN9696_c0_g1~~TRINITY_DN9696_c0_g1_i1.p1  ORF type:complete len:412 (+),score=60.05 TRINITY_DN9696_c0_g1_i1:35-1237(+)
MTGSTIFPQVLSNINHTVYEGAVGHYWIKLTDADRLKDKAALHVSQSLATKLGSTRLALLKRLLRNASSVDAFFEELRELLRESEAVADGERAKRPNALAQAMNVDTNGVSRGSRDASGDDDDDEDAQEAAARCAHLLRELDELGWDRVRHVSSTLMYLELACGEHTLCVEVPRTYPTVAPTFAAAAPFALGVRWRSSLCDAVAQCSDQLALLDPLRDALRPLDERCVVLEPSRPSLDCVARRIALGNRAALAFVVDWRNPLLPPQNVRIIGPHTIASPLKQRWADFVGDWVVDAPLVDNIERVLAVQLPRPSAGQEDESAHQCGICYSYRLLSAAKADTEESGATPDRVCDNERCGRPFHESCLYEWLRAVPANTHTFNTVFGACPYCTSKLSATKQSE